MTYTPGRIRWLLRHYRGYLEHGRFPPDDHAPSEKARGKVRFGPRSPANAAEVKADLDAATRALDQPWRETVEAVRDAGNLGRAARWLHRRKADVGEDYNAALEQMAAWLGCAVEVH